MKIVLGAVLLVLIIAAANVSNLQIGIGVVLGFLVALVLGRALGVLLFMVSATDPRVYGATAFTFIMVGTLAMLIPALRAARVNPLDALRVE